ncbi:PAS domain S-box-containing protein [Syntrophus gentianae]|uniref:PAS domain S-box-containing protein n=1 Tax=Syntrophus gentianae TaxID=43775 RepID=A0A1H7VYL7_9BACT|nr:sigma 54-interacting transcriptional regulator [Syntrophus gentianae]SEM14346.1 PAS domain S-box-containing protein [Syntrophus gentianae]
MRKLTEASERLNTEIKRRKEAQRSPRERLLFEELLSAISARFISLPANRVDEEIHNAMTEVLGFFKVDRFALLQTLPDKKSWMITHSVAGAGVPSVPIASELPISINPWAYEKLVLKKEVLSIEKMEDIPSEANVDKETWMKWGIRSNLNIPIMIGGPVDHILAINSVKQERLWPEELVPRLRLLGEIFVNAIERSKAQKALQESEERLSLATSAAEAGLWMLDIDTGILWATPILRELFGFHPDEVLSYERFQEAIHPDDLDGVKERVHQSIETKSFLIAEYRIRKPDGNLRWIVTRGRPENGTLGHPLRLMGVSMDITGLKEMESQLREQLVEINKLKLQLENENVYLREERKMEQGFGKMIGSSSTLQYVLFRAHQVAPTDATVLILGETGVGKGMVANAIHEMSARRDKPMVTVNCAALPANLIESELFGREKGAFTGAHARQIGRFEVANGGTIFLDEIGELPLELQAKLLRVLQDGEFERLGSPRTVKVDVRVIASTSRDLKEEMCNRRFREDLYYRLNTFPVTLPPLRMRIEDIPELARYFIDKYGRKMGKRFDTISKEAIDRLSEYSWPGNVRELEHIIERAVITSSEQDFQLTEPLEHGSVEREEGVLKEFNAMAREHIQQVLKETRWKIEGKAGAAAFLGLHPSTLRFRIKKLGLKRP